jgi:hypothetical protein
MLVINQITDQQPDLSVHLGDVYYGGTEAEEREFLTMPWRVGRLGAFALNSNHEMFNGGRGYFTVALDPHGPFGSQQQTSYFAIEGEDWVVLGLDTAYYDESAGFMDGALIDPQQVAFVRRFSSKRCVIVLTHHNAFNASGSALVENPKSGALFDNVVAALDGRAPDFWYWGHLHLGAVYKGVPWDPTRGAAPTTKCRCLGHGALPFGRPYYLDQQPDNVDYCARTPLVVPVDPFQRFRVKNGWTMLTIGPGGLSEECWETGDRAPIWRQAHAW